MKFNYPARTTLGLYPTPIHLLVRLSKDFEGPEIFVKRDDLTGITLTGNKIRKLEFLLAEAQRQKADVVITCGGAQSNHARTTAIACAQLGLRSHLVLKSEGSAALDGNLFLDRLVDAEITFVDNAQYETVDDFMAELAEQYHEKGIKAFVIPEGGSNELGALGYAVAMEEIAQQLADMKLHIDVLVIAVGSGGTYAGLLLGKHFLGLKTEIWGINICDDAVYFEKRIKGILRNAKKKYNLPESIESEAIQIIDGYVGKGYGLSRQEEIEAIKHVARLEGLILDPVYTGKAMYGVKDLIAQGKLQKKQKILFLHSGGIFGLFPKKNLFF